MFLTERRSETNTRESIMFPKINNKFVGMFKHIILVKFKKYKAVLKSTNTSGNYMRVDFGASLMCIQIKIACTY